MTTDAVRRYHRRRYLVNRPLQLPFVWLSLGTLMMMGIAICSCVFFALRVTLRVFEFHDDPVSVALFNAVGWMVVLELILLAPLVIWLGVWLTHKVAGPLVRIRASLQQMIAGDFNVHLTLRKGDALQELANDINCLADILRQRTR